MTVRRHRTILARALAADSRFKILDVGTGPGNFACVYSQLGHECIGLDFSENMLAVARQRTASMKLDCSFIFGDAENPPFPDECF